MSSPREIELKLDVPARKLPRLIDCSLLKTATRLAPRPADLVSVYFDTDKLKLHRRGVSLRVRQIGRRRVQTIKQEQAGSAVLLARGEWEREIATQRPDLDAARDTALAALVSKKLRRNLKPVFATRIRRKVFQIQSGDSEIELCIDQGRVEADRKSLPLCEVELELKRGEPTDLFRVAKLLAQQVPVKLAVKSKAERGYALVSAEKAQAVKAAPVALPPECDAQSAFRVIARGCLYQLVANQPMMLAGDAEALHQIRVALRRLRAAISLFSAMLRGPQTERLKAEFKWITGELGPARELEVFLRRIVKPVAGHERDEPGIKVASRELRQNRRDALARAGAAVESQRLRDLCLDTLAWIETGDWTRNPEQAAQTLRTRPISAVAAEQLHRRWKKILKRGKGLNRLDSQRRHKLRIRSKKLRYAAEFFGTAFRGNKSKRRRKAFLSRLEQLQDALGDLNDIAVNEKLSQHVAERENGASKERGGLTAKAFAFGRLSGREEARIAHLLQEAQGAFAAFAKAKPFWE